MVTFVAPFAAMADFTAASTDVADLQGNSWCQEQLLGHSPNLYLLGLSVSESVVNLNIGADSWE